MVGVAAVVVLVVPLVVVVSVAVPGFETQVNHRLVACGWGAYHPQFVNQINFDPRVVLV